jgi:hypothetical protein
MGPEAVTARLRRAAELLRARGMVARSVDMSPGAITGRLRTWGALSDMCHRLARLGAGLR